MNSPVNTSALLLLIAASHATAADWPQWRGPTRDGKSADVGLLQEWPTEGPALRWKAPEIGTGYSSPVILGDKLYIQSTNDDTEVCLAIDDRTGKTLWSTPIGKVLPNKGPNYPGTRATPTTDGDRLYCLASDGELVCLMQNDGHVKWQVNLMKAFQGEVGNWAYSESVLVDGDHVICTPGGKESTLAALNKMNGQVVWKAVVPGGDIADYASIMPLMTNDRKLYVQYLRNALVGVDAKTGQFLWKYTRTQDPGASILTPIVSGNRVFVSGSRSGGAVVEVTSNNQGAEVKEIFFNKDLGSSLGGVVLMKGHLYGTAGQTLYCAEFDTGKIKWTERSVGPASVCFADNRLYLRGYNSGEMALVDPTPEGYRECGRFRIPEKSNITGWPHPVVANGSLYIRDQNVLLSFDVKAKSATR